MSHRQPHCIVSPATRRNGDLLDSPDMVIIRSGFEEIAHAAASCARDHYSSNSADSRAIRHLCGGRPPAVMMCAGRTCAWRLTRLSVVYAHSEVSTSRGRCLGSRRSTLCQARRGQGKSSSVAGTGAPSRRRRWRPPCGDRDIAVIATDLFAFCCYSLHTRKCTISLLTPSQCTLSKNDRHECTLTANNVCSSS